MEKRTAERVAVKMAMEARRARPRAQEIHAALSAVRPGDDLTHLGEQIVATPAAVADGLSGWPYDSIRGTLAKGRVATLLASSEGLGPVDMASLLVLLQDHLPLNGKRV